MTVHELTDDRAPQSVEQHRARAAASPAVLANPAALGLAGFAVANLLLSVINVGWLPHSAIPAVLPLGFFAGGIAQLIAAAGEFRRGNTFGVTGFGSYGVFWLALVGFLGVEEPKFPSPAAASHALAVFLLCWMIWTVLLWVATFRVSLVLNLLFLDLIAVFAFLAAGLGFGNTTLVQVGGYLGIVLSVIGFYGALEAVVNETFGRLVIPNRTRSPRRRANVRITAIRTPKIRIVLPGGRSGGRRPADIAAAGDGRGPAPVGDRVHRATTRLARSPARDIGHLADV